VGRDLAGDGTAGATGQGALRRQQQLCGWDIATAQNEAKARHFTGLASEQSLYNLTARTIELEVIPACKHYGLGLFPWSPVGGGLLGGALQQAEDGRRSSEDKGNREAAATVAAYEDLCNELGEKPSDVAMAWLLHNPAVTAPIMGPRTKAQLTEGLRALDLSLSADTLQRLDAIWKSGPEMSSSSKSERSIGMGPPLRSA
jgi:aryl-alcohol dehydrogenase-like predicted oxidoreductase